MNGTMIFLKCLYQTICFVGYSSLPNKRADPNKPAGWNLTKKSNKRADLNKRAGWNFAQNTKKLAV